MTTLRSLVSVLGGNLLGSRNLSVLVGLSRISPKRLVASIAASEGAHSLSLLLPVGVDEPSDNSNNNENSKHNQDDGPRWEVLGDGGIRGEGRNKPHSHAVSIVDLVVVLQKDVAKNVDALVVSRETKNALSALAQ